MEGRIDFACLNCGMNVSALFGISEAAQVEVKRHKDFTSGLEVRAWCAGCEREHVAYVVEDDLKLDARVVGADEGLVVHVGYVKPSFLAPFEYPLEFASAAFLRIVLALDDTQALSKVEVAPTRLHDSYQRMLFVHLVASLETYLSETLIDGVTRTPSAGQRLLQHDRTLADEKVSLLAAFTTPDIAEKRIAAYLNGVLFHNLGRASNLYKIAFGAGFSYASEAHQSALEQAIARRHDCVHRNGRTLEGLYKPFTAAYVRSISEGITEFALSIERSMISFRRRKPLPPESIYADDIPF